MLSIQEGVGYISLGFHLHFVEEISCWALFLMLVSHFLKFILDFCFWPS